MRIFIGKRTVKTIAAFFITIMLWDIIFPAAAYALSGRPSQPEVQSFEPVGTTEMVDLFSGDFVYNIPLVDVEGFPINIAYHSGVGMDDEASWVGLGWNINPGVINRNLRGIPDDFRGDVVKSTTNIKENKTWGVGAGPSFEFLGWESKSGSGALKIDLGANLGVFYNNYRGLGAEIGLNATLKLADKCKPNNTLNLGLNLGANSQTGADVGTRLSFENDVKILGKEKNLALSFGASVNSRSGLNAVTFGYSLAKKTSPSNRTFDYGRTGVFILSPTTYTPKINNELISVAVNLGFSAGFEATGFNWKIGLQGYYNSQFLKNRVRQNNAYGYLYSQDALDVTNPGVASGHKMLDLNRENDGVYTKGKPFLPMPIFTYDMFSVSGEGTGGLIRPFRSDVGVMTDETTQNLTVGMGIHVAASFGNAFKWDGDLNGTFGYSVSGPWRFRGLDFDIVKNLGFQPQKSASSFEPFYFRSLGENTRANNDLFETMGGDAPVRIEVVNSAKGRLRSRLVPKYGNDKDIYNPVKYTNRQARNMSTTMLTNKEASKVGLNRRIKLFERNTFTITNKSITPSESVAREEAGTFASKMSELAVTNPDGRRYVYDIPAYNTRQVDAAFRVVDLNNPTSLQKDRSTGLVKYNAGDNSTGNGRGEDNYYNSNETPAYAHSFLLSSILSADYVDITGNGISDDDIGTAVKLNYTKAYTDYKWRTPFGKGDHQANYDEGLKSDIYDDRGNYIYGEKEIWYVHSVESKNYVACFYTSRRDDACQVLGEDGGIDTSASFYKLDSIKLFTKEELRVNAGAAVPLKTVHFEYDYTLCLNTENNRNYNPLNSSLQAGTGKLTLKKIYFTYGNSKKGKTNSYQFTYSDYNPSYNLRGYDRWGNYKPNASLSDANDINNPNTQLSNVDNPYVNQNKDSADLYSSAWSLTQIKLPSGGKIQVNYESDDYAYIQDRQAGQMFRVTGISENSTFYDNPSELYNSKSEANKLYIFFDLQEPIDTSATAEELAQKNNDYFANIEKMYFKFLVDLTGKGDWEYVSGYTDKTEVGFTSKSPTDGVYNLGYVKLKEVNLTDEKGKINPITKAAWNFMRMYAPKKLAKMFSNYEQPPASTSLKGVLSALAGSMNEMGNFFNKSGNRLRNKGAGQNIALNKCFIRLNNPTKMKYGGGVRVKQVSLSDDWDAMVSGQEASTYGQKYLYTKEEKLTNGTYRTISSGVATWEPAMGGDENSLKQPVEYTGTNHLAPDDQYMIETPIGESLFPSPNVGYSYVTTINIKPTENIKRTGTGKVVNEFYTAYDFPMILKNTNVDKQPKRSKPGFLASFLNVYVKDKAFVSQGYSIELNNMHGKPKSQWIFEEDNNVPISGVRYHYNYKVNEDGKNQLVSKVDVVSPSGSISSAELGREIDYMFDTRNSYSYHAGATLQTNSDGFLAAIFPVVIPSIFSSISVQELEFGSAVNTKVITRYGILKATEVFENGASVKTENVLFDSETGAPLMAKTTNEFNDTIYTFNYPAHFAYEGMGQAYKNIGYYFKDIRLVNGELQNLNNYRDYFVPGDELYVEYEKYNGYVKEETGILPIKVWAVESPHYADELIFLTRTGAPFNTNLSESGKTFKYNLKIIRSGRRNMQGASIGSVVSLANPIVSGTLSFDSIINSSAVEFADNWPAKHLYVFEDIDIEPQLQQSNPACNDSCLRELKTLLFPAMIAMKAGDTLNLMETPYRDYYLCQLSMREVMGCPSSEGDYYRDSLLIRTTRRGGSIANNYIPSSFDDIRYASTLDQKGDNIAAEFTANRSLILPAPLDLLEENNPILFSKESPLGLNSSSALKIITPGCGICDLILNSEPTDSITEFITERGCKRELSSKCTKTLSTFDPDCIIPKVQVLECATNTIPPLQSIYAMTVPPSNPGNYCGDYYMLLSDKGYGCGKSANGVTKKYVETGSGDSTQICGDTAYDGAPVLGFINPYIYGTKGNWRPKRSWLFYDKRNQASTTNIRKDGTYKNYTDFWKKPVMSGQYWDTGSSISSKWVWNTQVTKFNKTGNEIENKDALGIYSSALFGYGNSMVKAVANNAKQRQILFDGFDDYDYYTTIFDDHFSFIDYKSSIDGNKSHTGISSIKLNDNSSISYLNYTFYGESETDTITIDTSINAILLHPKDLIEHFSPDTGRYIISAWVSEDISSPKYNGYTDTIVVKLIEQSCIESLKFIPSGPVIEGWQRIVGEFTVKDSMTAYEIILKSDSSDKAYFDDIRIHPWNGNMKSFVYHPRTLRLVAELDENNYATFYEYDDEGRLIRIKRETERGIVTLQESRTGLKIND